MEWREGAELTGIWRWGEVRLNPVGFLIGQWAGFISDVREQHNFVNRDPIAAEFWGSGGAIEKGIDHVGGLAMRVA